VAHYDDHYLGYKYSFDSDDKYQTHLQNRAKADWTVLLVQSLHGHHYRHRQLLNLLLEHPNRLLGVGTVVLGLLAETAVQVQLNTQDRG
jgi:hypothetical protein